MCSLSLFLVWFGFVGLVFDQSALVGLVLIGLVLIGLVLIGLAFVGLVFERLVFDRLDLTDLI